MRPSTVDEKIRCEWSMGDPLLLDYHDKEWGVPVHKDNLFFEFLTLEGAQAGLSWLTILRKRESYRRAFDNFDPERISRYDESRISKLLQNGEIVRNRLKVSATVHNAQNFLEVQKELGSFDRYIWRFVSDGTPRQNRWKKFSQVPATTPESDAMSLDLKKRGFKFVGSTICYSFMQATGMVNDHAVTCFRFAEISKLR
jgi:DNA-3-methyladenine glycosylase I